MSVFAMSSMNQIFRGSLTFYWKPNRDEPTIVANKINQIDFKLRDFELPMLAAKEIAVEDMEYRFATETDLDHKPWQPRSPRTIKEYRWHHYVYSTIMKKNEYLYDAVTDRDSYDVVDNNLVIDTSNWPVYWHAHNVGSRVGKGVKLPKRSFAGISTQAQFTIIDIFEDYLVNALQIIRPGVTGIPMFRGAFGRIGGRISAGMPRTPIKPIVPGVRPTGTGMEFLP